MWPGAKSIAVAILVIVLLVSLSWTGQVVVPQRVISPSRVQPVLERVDVLCFSYGERQIVPYSWGAVVEGSLLLSLG